MRKGGRGEERETRDFRRILEKNHEETETRNFSLRDSDYLRVDRLFLPIPLEEISKEKKRERERGKEGESGRFPTAIKSWQKEKLSVTSVLKSFFDFLSCTGIQDLSRSRRSLFRWKCNDSLFEILIPKWRQFNWQNSTAIK